MVKKRLLSLAVACIMLGLLGGESAMAQAPALDDVTGEMANPAFWTEGLINADEILADSADIRQRNAEIQATDACNMIDMLQIPESFDTSALYRNIWSSAFSDAASVLRTEHYDRDNMLLSGGRINRLLENIGDSAATETATRYGICVRRSDVVAIPSDLIATDEEGDTDYNFYQLSAVRVNEPVAVKAVSRDGRYYFCDTECVSGWIRAEDIAICSDKAEWLEAWDIADEDAIVVTEGKLYLEDSNVNPVTSRVCLTMGTVLKKVSPEEYDSHVTGRLPVYNYAVWLPVRQADGSYSKTIALISQHYQISEGYLPLTVTNILTTAFNKLGDTYGWGSMLNSVDCSNYIRDIYKCFGLSLARNTVWQSAMPVLKYDVSEADDQTKEELLDQLLPGTVLYFSGHEMMYLGHKDHHYYVLSAVSRIQNPTGEGTVKIRGVAINTLDVTRPNGKTWLESLDTLLVPYLPAAEAEEEDGEDFYEPLDLILIPEELDSGSDEIIAGEAAEFYDSDEIAWVEAPAVYEEDSLAFSEGKDLLYGEQSSGEGSEQTIAAESWIPDQDSYAFGMPGWAPYMPFRAGNAKG